MYTSIRIFVSFLVIAIGIEALFPGNVHMFNSGHFDLSSAPTITQIPLGILFLFLGFGLFIGVRTRYISCYLFILLTLCFVVYPSPSLREIPLLIVFLFLIASGSGQYAFIRPMTLVEHFKRIHLGKVAQDV
jgi:hypothetical protein